MSVRDYAGYPAALGPKMTVVSDVTGPSDYTTGGSTYQALSFGLSYVDFAGVSVSVSGNYFGIFVPVGTLPESTFKVLFYSLAGGEVNLHTNLSAEHFVMYVLGM